MHTAVRTHVDDWVDALIDAGNTQSLDFHFTAYVSALTAQMRLVSRYDLWRITSVYRARRIEFRDIIEAKAIAARMRLVLVRGA